MSMNRATGLGRFIIVGLLMLATLGFGLAGLCGAAFTLMSLPDLAKPGSYAGAALVVAIPSLLIGGGIAWLCGRRLVRLLRHDDSAAP
ncbi:MAG: hypothetical protein GXC94_14630 [Comamonadaceae bacterium]|jgi:hypothetical protein|nr:hypothetical protein [Comamonadaceae bacterium]